MEMEVSFKNTFTSIISAAGDNSETAKVNKWRKNIHLHLMEEPQHKAERKCPRK